MAVDGNLFGSRPPIEDATEVYAEAVAEWRQAVAAARAANKAQQRAAAAWLDSGLETTGEVVRRPD